jgi:hypothetical protein
MDLLIGVSYSFFLAAKTLAVDDDAVSDTVDEGNKSNADAYGEEQADPGYEGDKVNEDSETDKKEHLLSETKEHHLTLEQVSRVDSKNA